MVNILKVGELYRPAKTRYPEGTQYNYYDGGHQLEVFMNRPSDAEIKAASEGQSEFAFCVERDVLFFLYRFGDGIPWGDCPYSYHLVPADRRQVPPEMPSPESRALLNFALVDASTGILRTLKVISFSPLFSRALHAAIREQAARPWPGNAAYDVQLNTIYQKFTTKQLLQRAVAKCKGGID